jgi:uncharacterized membrane protein HdeD (DUF308 family)
MSVKSDAMAAAPYVAEPEAPQPRWFLVAGGVLWLLFGLVVLSFDSTSVGAISLMVAFALILGGFEELIRAVDRDGWRWAHALLGFLFIITGVAALFEPLQTFGILALIVGWFLIMKGAMDITLAVSTRDVLPLWGLFLAAGIGEIALGIWAIGYPGRSAWLLILWVGIGALIRSVNDFVAAFSKRSV